MLMYLAQGHFPGVQHDGAVSIDTILVLKVISIKQFLSKGLRTYCIRLLLLVAENTEMYNYVEISV